ncbi:MAG: 5'-methylthioadenosine/adenosylhomocysteine nucleosidase [Treponema sp.]|nr:5'-methylthioadenosine/adenosylhomocysteine nucleosidase [Treponema sp.]
MADRKIGIIGAMEVEVKALRSLLVDAKDTKAGGLDFTEGSHDGVSVVIVRSGVGKVNAALCAQRLALQFGVTHVINTGIAGAMAHGLKVLDFVVSTDALYHDMDATGFGYKRTEIPQMSCSNFPADKGMVEAAKKAFPSLPEAEGHKLVEGRIATGDQFISDRAVKEQIRTSCDPACVEMEGAAIAHACYLNGIPFVIIRCLSDMADDVGENTYSFNEEAAANLSAALVRKMLKGF